MARIPLPDGPELDAQKALALRPELATGVAAFEHAVWNSGLDWRLHELLRMRVAQINQCTVCLNWRTPQAIEAGVTDELLDNVDRAEESDLYSPAERTALEYTAHYCTDSTNIDDELLARLNSHFDSGEIVELTLVIGKYLALGRFMQVLGLDQSCDLRIDDTGAVTAH